MSILTTNNFSHFQKMTLIACLVLISSVNNTAYSTEKPLSTIGEPQINQPARGLNSPFNATPSTPEAKPDIQASPFNNAPDINKTNSVAPVKAQPQVEDIKGVQEQGKTQSLLADPNNKLGLAYPFKKLEDSKNFLKKKDISGAKAIVEPLSEWLTHLTEYHIELFKKLNGIDTAKNQAQVEKRLALDSALLRDKAYYQLALIYLAENKEREAVKYLIEVIKSQPKTELGMKSYEILQQIGFTEKVRLVR